MANRGAQAAEIHLLPTLWFRNTWSWAGKPEPALALDKSTGTILAHESETGDYRLCYAEGGTPLFTENETNSELLFSAKNSSPYVKDAFHRYVINGETTAVNPELKGTKAAVQYKFTMPPGGEVSIKLRLSKNKPGTIWSNALRKNLKTRLPRARLKPTLLPNIIPSSTDDDTRNVMRQAFAGLLWTKQYYHYVVRDWLHG